MIKHGRCVCFVLIVVATLSGCVSNIWTGASLVYNRHSMYKKFDDYQLARTASHVLFDDKRLAQKACVLDLAVFNGDVLLVGHVPDGALKQLVMARLARLRDYRQIYSYIAVSAASNKGIEDAWITTKIRSHIIADSQIDPNVFKIVTVDGVVYVMGDVKPDEGARVLQIARNTNGVIRVVTLLKYYRLSDNTLTKK